MKKISVVLPTYNEVDNIKGIVVEIVDIFQSKLNNYDYEILITDNCSTDGTRDEIRQICNENIKVKAIFNAKNFPGGSGRNAYKNTTGDCVISLAADFQDPPRYIPEFIKKWEEGYKIVGGVKSHSKTNFLMHKIRGLYYKIIKTISDIEQIEHLSTYMLLDRSFVDVINNIVDRRMYMRGLIGELGYKITTIEYVQEKRRAGKSSNNFWSLYDVAMRGITSYSKAPLRIVTFLGVVIGFVSAVIGVVYFILKCVNWYSFDAGIAPLIIIVAFLGAMQLFSIGFIGEYIMAINERSMDRPLVIEEERLNFDE